MIVVAEADALRVERDALRAENDEANARITTLEWQLSEATKAAERLRAALEEAYDTPQPWPHALITRIGEVLAGHKRA